MDKNVVTLCRGKVSEQNICRVFNVTILFTSLSQRSTYEVCLLNTRKSSWAESFFNKIFFIALSVLESFCFSPFRRSFTWSAVANPPFIFLSLPPPILRYSDFMKSLVTARKSFIWYRKLSRRSTMTKPRWERSYKRLSKGEIGEQVSAAADQRNRTATVFIAGIAAEVENDHWESVMKLAQGHDVSAKTVHAILHNDLQLSRSRPGGWSNCFTRRRKEAIQSMTGDHSCSWSRRRP